METFVEKAYYMLMFRENHLSIRTVKQRLFDGVTKRLTRHEAVSMLEVIDSARRCNDEAELVRLIGSLDSLVPFGMAVCGIARLDGGGGITPPRIVNVSYPWEWLSIYEEQGFVTVDPVVRAHFADFSPKIWSDAYKQWGRPRPFLSLAEDFGIRDGYSFGGFSPGCTATSIFSLCTDGKPCRHTLEILEYLAPHFHEALQRIAMPTPPSCIEALTPREHEVLRWLANGKSSWEISMILGISERTVKFHIGAVLNKLGAANRAHAVAIALSCGMIGMG